MPSFWFFHTSSWMMIKSDVHLLFSDQVLLVGNVDCFLLKFALCWLSIWTDAQSLCCIPSVVWSELGGSPFHFWQFSAPGAVCLLVLLQYGYSHIWKGYDYAGLSIIQFCKSIWGQFLVSWCHESWYWYLYVFLHCCGRSKSFSLSISPQVRAVLHLSVSKTGHEKSLPL